LFEDAGFAPPDNLSLYLNRLRERGFLEIPENTEDKNRFAVLTSQGREHLNKRSSA
jgi:DNA-binding MarR family transcriptional regulator